MFWRLDPEPDLESSARQEDLQFDDPFWIIDHHRRNIILKIFKPEGASSSRSRNIQSSSNAKARIESKNERSYDQREREYSYRIDFSELQRLNLRKLQHKLIQHAVDLRSNASEPTRWAEDLRQYVQALQDYDYMGKHVQLPRNPF